VSVSALIVVAVVVVGVPVLLGLLFKWLWKVPAADQALIVTGLGSRKAAPGGKVFKIVTGGGALVLPVLQKAQYLTLKADKAILEVEGVDQQKIPVGVRGVAIFKVGDDTFARSSAGCQSRT
jgi:flotillin